MQSEIPFDLYNNKALGLLASQSYHSEHLLEAQEISLLPFWFSPLGRLPPEVRELIYVFAFIMEPPKWGWKPSSPYWLTQLGSSQRVLGATLPFGIRNPGRTMMPHLALLCTCRQIYQEARDLYYSTDFFSFTKLESMMDVLLGSGRAVRHELQYIRKILSCTPHHVSWSVDRRRAFWKALADVSHCEPYRRLKIVVDRDWNTEVMPDSYSPYCLHGLTGLAIYVRSNLPFHGRPFEWRLIQDGQGSSYQLTDRYAAMGPNEKYVYLGGLKQRRPHISILGAPNDQNVTASNQKILDIDEELSC